MPQEYRPRITDEEASLLRAIPELYRLGGAAVDVKSYVVWGDRIVLAFYADGKRYFLKEWPEHVIDGDEVTFILKVQEYARRRGVPVPETLRTTGEQDVMLWGKRRLSLQRFVGEAYDPHRHWEQKLSCSKVLGLLHSTLEDSQFEHKKRPSDPFTSSRQFISDARSRQPKKELRAEHNKIVVCILEGFEEVLGLAEDRLTTTGWQDMPSMPIHGDYCQFNCRFSGNSVVGIVDWDLVRMAPRILDLAFFLNIALGWTANIDYYEDYRWCDTTRFQESDLRALIEQYLLTAPSLKGQEIEALPYVCASVWPMPVAGFEPLDESAVPNCEAALTYMRRLVESADQLTDLIDVAIKLSGRHST